MIRRTMIGRNMTGGGRSVRTTSLIAALAGLLSLAAPGNAAAAESSAGQSTASAFERCRDGWTPNVTLQTSIAGHASTTVVGYPTQFWPGDVFRVRAVGTIHTSALPWDDYNANGRVGDPAPTNDAAWPGPGRTKFSLVGAFGNAVQGYMQLGTQTWCVEVPSWEGKTSLRMWINDNVTADNSGRWDIAIDQYYA